MSPRGGQFDRLPCTVGTVSTRLPYTSPRALPGPSPVAVTGRTAPRLPRRLRASGSSSHHASSLSLSPPRLRGAVVPHRACPVAVALHRVSSINVATRLAFPVASAPPPSPSRHAVPLPSPPRRVSRIVVALRRASPVPDASSFAVPQPQLSVRRAPCARGTDQEPGPRTLVAWACLQSVYHTVVYQILRTVFQSKLVNNNEN